MALCGHATLGAAHALFESGVPPHRLVFSSKSGPLHASLDAATKRIVMDFPEVRRSLGLRCLHDVSVEGSIIPPHETC